MKLEEKKPQSLAMSVIVDGSFLVGGALLTYGAYLAYAPAGFITPGLLLLGVSIVGARR